MNLERELLKGATGQWQQICISKTVGSLREEQTMQTVHPRYTLAERLVLAVVTMITWPVEHFLGWARRKVAVDLVPTANRR